MRTIEDDRRLRDEAVMTPKQYREAQAEATMAVRRASQATEQRRASKAHMAGLIEAIDNCIC